VLVDLLCELPRAQGVNLKDPWKSFIEAAEEIDDTDLEVDLNFFPTPRGDRGRIGNIRQDNFTMGHLFRAAFQNMAESFYDCAVQLDREESWKTLLLSGGLACKLEILRRVIQERFDTTYRLPPHEEDTLFGLLILATVFSGRAASVQEMTEKLRT
jgi:sugar (pentulose or hexulose) kinase